MSDFGREKWPQGRKVHRCIWCGEPIPAGETHLHSTGRWEGEWQDWRMHRECARAFEDQECGEILPYQNERPSRERTAREIREEQGRAGQLVLGVAR